MTRALVAVLVLVLVASGAACHRDSQLMVVVDTDLEIPTELDRIEIVPSGATETEPPVSADLTATTGPPLPLTLALVAVGALRPVRVQVVGLRMGREVIRQVAQTEFVSGEARMLRVPLLARCLGVTCSDGFTCGPGGACVSMIVPGGSLPAWDGPQARLAPPNGPQIAVGGAPSLWASGWYTCAQAGTTLYCWGQNNDGQLGDGSTSDSVTRRPVSGLTLPDLADEPANLGLGSNHACLCARDGTLSCWGRNLEGQLGIGNTTNASRPTPVPGITDCQQVTGGTSHTCVLHQSGKVSCWGNNTSGQCGQSARVALLTPQVIAGLERVGQVRAGQDFTCALGSGGVVCWGQNTTGQLGDGSTTSRETAAPVAGVTGVAELAVGRTFSCARLGAGQVRCWGANTNGQLGNGGTAATLTPVTVSGVGDAAQLSLGLMHACVLRRGGVVSCWGGNSNGQLGSGSLADSSAPSPPIGLTDVITVAAGSIHTCARHSGGISCWGANATGQLGNGSATMNARPVPVAGFLR